MFLGPKKSTEQFFTQKNDHIKVETNSQNSPSIFHEFLIIRKATLKEIEASPVYSSSPEIRLTGDSSCVGPGTEVDAQPRERGVESVEWIRPFVRRGFFLRRFHCKLYIIEYEA